MSRAASPSAHFPVQPHHLAAALDTPRPDIAVAAPHYYYPAGPIASAHQQHSYPNTTTTPFPSSGPLFATTQVSPSYASVPYQHYSLPYFDPPPMAPSQASSSKLTMAFPAVAPGSSSSRANSKAASSSSTKGKARAPPRPPSVANKKTVESQNGVEVNVDRTRGESRSIRSLHANLGFVPKQY